MFRPVRTLISLAFVGLMVWAAFAVPLGGRTFAQHMDRIGQTPEATELLEGTRSTVNPVIQEATDRVLGEYVEAPTDRDRRSEVHAGGAGRGTGGEATAKRREPSSEDRTQLPGR